MIRGKERGLFIWQVSTDQSIILDNINTVEKLRKLLLINCEKWNQTREREIQISNMI